MVFDIARRTDRSEPVIAAYLVAKLDRRERLMGFGHRIYRVRDPRADVLGAAADALFNSPTASAEDRALYALAKRVESTALRVLTERYPQRALKTNVEFYTALLLHGLDLPIELFSPTFAMSRVVGWLAHAFEQRAERRIIRPASVYIGAIIGAIGAPP
jgi:citrate synthase